MTALSLGFSLFQGASCLARALRANNALTDLDLRWNEVGNEGARAIRDSLDTNSSLTSVKLSGNKVGLPPFEGKFKVRMITAQRRCMYFPKRMKMSMP